MSRIHPKAKTSSTLQLVDASSFESYEETIVSSKDPVKTLQINKARCDRYIPEKPKDDKKQAKIAKEVCGCGKTLDQHEKTVVDNYKLNGVLPNEKWTADNCTVDDGLTDAYGEIKFQHHDNTAKYIRVSHKTDIDKIMDLFRFWKLKDPKLLISVTGGAQKFVLKPLLTHVFRKGLVKAATSTGAWISTGGFNTGVMKHVGEAIREHAITLNANEKLVVLGIATWSKVAGTKSLIRPIDDPNPFKHPKDYTLNLSAEDKADRKQALDPNHSHFILVDNAKEGFGGEIKFRGLLESAISKKQNMHSTDDRNKANEIPIVVLVLEGGVGTIETVFESVKNVSPCLFVEGSGKCADLFAYAITRIAEREKEYNNQLNKKDKKSFIRVDEKLEEEIIELIKKNWGDKDVEKALEQIKYVLEYPHLLSVFRLNSNDEAYEIDVAILRALLKAKRDNYRSQLKLALTWNRVDIAKQFIFTEDTKWKPGDLNDIMYDALLENRVEFVRLILDNGFDLKAFLTNRCLLKLYNSTISQDMKKKSSEFYQLLVKRSRKQTNPLKAAYGFKEIGEVIQDLVGDIYEPEFVKEPYRSVNAAKTLEETDEYGKLIDKRDIKEQRYAVIGGVTQDQLKLDEKNEAAEHYLFIYAVLHVRFDMAKLFWQEGNNEISSALLASNICKSFAKKFDEYVERFTEMANIFEEMAVDLLQNCYVKNEVNAQNLLIREIKLFGHSTPLQIAVSFDGLKFVSHPCTQGLLTRLWYNKIIPDTGTGWILLSAVFPPIAPAIIEYLEDRHKKLNQSPQDTSGKPDLKRSKSVPNETNRITDFTDSGRDLTYWEKIYLFVKAPIVKFIYDQFFYMLFLVLFSYVMLCDFFPFTTTNDYRDRSTIVGDIVIGVPEIVLIIWVITYSIEEIRQFIESDTRLIRAKFRLFFSFWNLLELSSVVLFMVAVILRFIPDSYQCYLAARILLCLDLVLWYFKALNYYSVIKNLGPKLVMIKKMMLELMYFIFIVIIFMFGFGVATQSLMYHNQPLDSNLLFNVFFPAYFIIGGEYFTRERIMNSALGSCDALENATSYSQDCGEESGARVALALYVGYLILLDILLVNLLIAIFSKTYEKVEEDTDEIWKFQRYGLIYEYYHRPILTPPFVIFSYAISFIRLFLRPIRKRCCTKLSDKKVETNIFKRLFIYMSKEFRTGFRIEFNEEEEEKKLVRWESNVADECVYKEEQRIKESDSYKIQEIFDQVEYLNRRVDEMTDSRDNMIIKLDNVEQNVSKILDLLQGNKTPRNEKSVILQVNSTPEPNKQNKTPNTQPVIQSTVISKNALTSVENNEQKPKENIKPFANPLTPANKESRSQRYPKSNVFRFFVPDDKVSWEVEWPDYHPVEYTTKSNNGNFDPDLLSKLLEMKFNAIDEKFNVDRRSCLGKYKVVKGLPINPVGRTGITGRGSLSFWGPNHAIQAIITRWKKDKNGKYITNDNKKVMEFIVVEKIDSDKWHLPHLMLEFMSDKEDTIIENLIAQIFDEDKENDPKVNEEIRKFIRKEYEVDKHYKDNHRNTDNAWIEIAVVNYHDDSDMFLTRLPIKTAEINTSVKWKDFDSFIEMENPNDYVYLKQVAAYRNANV